MVDLFTINDPLRRGYLRTYEALSELRERFHRSGRLDDSNAKLDEVSKIFASYLAFKLGQIGHFPDTSSRGLVHELQLAFTETANLPHYRLSNGSSIFGSQPVLSIRAGDEAMSADIVNLVREGIDLAMEFRTEGRPYDILNEAFGHFVRDNFRSNIEDAQYMTPPEVTDFMSELVMNDILLEEAMSYRASKNLTVVDPCCGVGSFLGAFYQRAIRAEEFDHKQLQLIGQDKVERMARLSTLNLQLFDVAGYQVNLGNSLDLGSPLDSLNGMVDVVITNPPFGARFDQDYLDVKCGSNTPYFSYRHKTASSISSELLFVDRGLRLLRDGGRLLIVVPDSVVSARGVSALYRQYLARTCTLRAVIELPTTTFAQAGTRTRTSILYLQKKRDHLSPQVFMGVSKDLGFQVSSRKGVQRKIARGSNDLPSIAAAYINQEEAIISENARALSTNPSCVVVPQATVFRGSWTPKHHGTDRFSSIAHLGGTSGFQLVPLGELVDFLSPIRKPESWHDGCAFISVRHIYGEGLVSVSGAIEHAPKTPGVQTFSGELLISRINPQIPRVCVTPDLGMKTLCSSEFEVMSAREDHNTYELAYLMHTEMVQRQIRSLTSGTSASHNRIRTSELSEVLIPIGKLGSRQADRISEIAEHYQRVIDSIVVNALTLAGLRRLEREIFYEYSPLS